MEVRDADSPLRILILTPFGRDAVHLGRVLTAAGFRSFACGDIPQAVAELAADNGVLVISEEVLSHADAHLLIAKLGAQPKWSALPTLVFCSSLKPTSRRLPALANANIELTYLQRPATAAAILNAVSAGVRDRTRQYQMRELLTGLQADLDEKIVREALLSRFNREASEAREIADSANRSKTQFLAKVSHELRTPLGAIMGFADLLSQTGLAPETASRYISVIRRNSHQLLRIVDDILDLSKVEVGKFELEELPFSLSELLSDFAALIELRARERNIVFRVQATSPLPKQLNADPTRIRQILLNVVGNAIKFTERGAVELNVAYREGILEFEVSDTGRGISIDQAAALFRPFSQADASITRKFGGTGLGLALVRRLCEAMQGRFFLKSSEVNRGSTFVAQMHVKALDAAVAVDERFFRSVPQDPPAVTDDAHLLSGHRLLVVEDSPDNQTLIQVMLEKAGARVDIAEDGLEGVRKTLAGSYSLVLMDVQMPNLSGIDAVKVLRQSSVRTPIVAFTAHAMKDERLRCLEAGFDGFLTKPIHREELFAVIAHLLGVGAPVAAAPPDPPRPQGKILLVEDDEDIRDAVSGLLESEGFEIQCAASGEEALDRIERYGPPSVVLVDFSLPGINGGEVIKRLNERPDRGDFKTFLLSGWGDLAAKATDSRADGYFRKPLEIDPLLQSLNQFRPTKAVPDLAKN